MVRVEVMEEEGERVLVTVRVIVVERVLVREEETVAVAERVSNGVRVFVTVRVIMAVPEAVREAAAEGVDGMVGLGDLEGNPDRVAVRVEVAVMVGMMFIAASCRSGLKSCTEWVCGAGALSPVEDNSKAKNTMPRRHIALIEVSEKYSKCVARQFL